MNKIFAFAGFCSLALVATTLQAQQCCQPYYPAVRTVYQPVQYQNQCCATRQCATCNTGLPAPTLTQRPVVQRRMIVYRPLIPIAPRTNNYVYGRGIIGQPKAYVPGQPVRNFLRYLSP